jgi:hypothetical protein
MSIQTSPDTASADAKQDIRTIAAPAKADQIQDSSEDKRWHRATSPEIQKGHLTPNRTKATACARAPGLRGRRNHPVRHQPGRTGPGREHHHQHGHLDQRAHHMHGANAKVWAPTLNKDRKRLHRAAWEVAAVASTLRRRLSTSSAALLASAA